MSGDKRSRGEWNEIIKLIPFEHDGGGYIVNGIERFAEAVFSRKPDERIGFALGVMKDLCSKKEYRKVVKLCDFVTAQFVNADMNALPSGLSAETEAVLT